ncbi:MAG: tRNA (N(6)-L-threonylcarbamoyladenosine(37)-C(2))-methylthiotransferase MtaB [Clostridia bacterium]|nr:tRNA (N(6)-L-threonylcarbamoyladenosine(37)-C(2))-methylthiotransferase MtaB [Clostridia bacterium]
MKTVSFYTLGCKVNQYETNAMAQKFTDAGYKIVHEEENADIAIVNTCTVTNMSDRKSRQLLRRIKRLNSNTIVIAVGCYVQVARHKVEKIPEIDLVLGNNEKQNIVEYVEKYINDHNNLNEVTDVMHKKEFVDLGIITYTEQTRAVIKIQDGCDRFCSYCIIPYARGRVRSRKPESIIEEAKKQVEQGLQEIVITGIHVASYGKDFDEDYKLIDLLENLNKIEGLKRIRLSSIEPMIITDEFIKRLSKLEKICHHFHLSLQSGCDETLKRMNRKYTTAEFMGVVKRLRREYEDVILTTDIIVGFPGETEEEFETTYNFLKEVKFYKMHVFKYSQREGTKAAVMPEQIDGKVKEERSQRLIKLSNQNQKEYNGQYIGKEVEVLFEEREGKYYKGHTANYIMVKFETEKELENCIKTVQVNDQEEDYLIAK